MKKLAAIALICALSVGLTGCSGRTIFSNYRELENLELIHTVGVDTAGEGVSVTVSGRAAQDKPPEIFEHSAGDIAEALGQLQKLPLGKDTMLSHTEAMVLGEEVAREGIYEYLDYVARYSEMRIDTGIYVVRDGTAKDLVQGTAGKTTSAADVLSSVSKNLPKLGDGYAFTCNDVSVSLANTGTALVMALRVVEREKLYEEASEKDVVSAGFALIREGKLVDYLTEEETFGTTILMSKFNSTEKTVRYGDAALTLNVDSIDAKISPEFGDDGELERLLVNVKAEANVANIEGRAMLEDDALRRGVERELSKLIGASVEAALRREKAMGVDFAGLRGTVERKEPVKFRKMKTSWEELFPTLEVQVKVKSELERTYDMVDSMDGADEEGKSYWETVIRSLKGS